VETALLFSGAAGEADATPMDSRPAVRETRNFIATLKIMIRVQSTKLTRKERSIPQTTGRRRTKRTDRQGKLTLINERGKAKTKTKACRGE